MNTFRDELQNRDLACVTYLVTMLTGGSVAQRAALRWPLSREADVINELTKKFSLWQ
jgi:hypothetical protein